LELVDTAAVLAAGEPAALYSLDGVPLVGHAAAALLASRRIGELVVVAPPGRSAEIRHVLDAHLPGHDAVVVDGAENRAASLRRAMAGVRSTVDVVVLHDANRPLAPAGLVARVIDGLADDADVVLPVLAVTETVKEVDAEGRVVRTVPRESLRRVQAPLAVRRSVLAAALATEDADPPAHWPVGTRVRTVRGDDDALAVVQPADLAVAEAVLAARRVVR
jgi:2-C-methyl-D-erythritol 4-phosphate cytidylyltransferase